MTTTNLFSTQLKSELATFLDIQSNKFPKNETLTIDLHCHDFNSDVPDELLGRILGVPETWTSTEIVLNSVKSSGCNVFTITNHNNTTSCYQLKEKGHDIIVGAEFSCTVPDYNIGIHVLAYGFNKKQEAKLLSLRKDIYKFLQYAHKHQIPTIWAHPLYNYHTEKEIPLEFYNKMMIIFERFEVLNGQRDTWQNLLVKNWIESCSIKDIDKYAIKYDIDLSLYSNNPYKKAMSGGSDSHMGIFAGLTGTILHIPNLRNRLKKEKASDLAIEAILNGAMAPFGTHQNSEKLLVAFIGYFMQIALFHKDAGLIRTITHNGDPKTKLIALAISNAFSELSRHKVTMKFIKVFYENFYGKKSSKLKQLAIPKIYRQIFYQANKIADAHKFKDERIIKEFSDTLNSITNEFNNIFYHRLNKKLNDLSENESFTNLSLKDIIEKIEIPSDFRSLFGKKESNWKTNILSHKKKKLQKLDISKIMDDLSFPLLASTLLTGANFASSKVLYNNRPLLDEFSKQIGTLVHPKRMLWLTDTFSDKNGVSSVLQEIHKEIKRKNLPIDILVCSNNVQPDDHLIVVKPLLEYTFPFYKEQALRIPSLQNVQNLFFDNGYDRIMCSTEGVMGLISIYLKNAYSVPTSFYMHTDWLSFAKKTLNLDQHNINRIRRLIRSYYKHFDNIFVLNSSHHSWLKSRDIGFPKKNIYRTAHWVDNKFKMRIVSKKKIFNLAEDDNILLFAGRLSKEKGLIDIPYIYEQIKDQIPNLKIVFAGTGPYENYLKEKLPEAIFMGWVNSDNLPNIYSAADLLILPSRFDTFSLVVLESISCGLPVIAYNSKGPRDIIEHQSSGYLVNSKKNMAKHIVEYFDINTDRKSFTNNAIERSKHYNKNDILNTMLKDLDLSEKN